MPERDRGTIRPSVEVYEELNAERKELGLTWDSYLTSLRGGGLAARVEIDTDEIVAGLVERTGDELVQFVVDEEELAKYLAEQLDELGEIDLGQVTGAVRDEVRTVLGRELEELLA